MNFDNILNTLKDNASYLSPESCKWGYISGVQDCAKAFLFILSKEGLITDKQLHKSFETVKTLRNGL